MTQMDEKDKKILEILKEHGDYTTRQIAKKTLLPPTTIHNRIRKLRKEKIIKKFTIELDHDRVGKGLLVYVLISADLGLLKRSNKSQYDLVNELRKLGFIERADIVVGGPDIVAVVRVKDVKEYDKVLLDKIQKIEGVDKTQSLIVIH